MTTLARLPSRGSPCSDGLVLAHSHACTCAGRVHLRHYQVQSVRWMLGVERNPRWCVLGCHSTPPPHLCVFPRYPLTFFTARGEEKRCGYTNGLVVVDHPIDVRGGYLLEEMVGLRGFCCVR